MAVILSVDPGSVHVGVAFWESDPWRVVECREFTVDQYLDLLVSVCTGERVFERVWVEGFRLRSGTPQGGSSLVVVQLIGATRLACRVAGVSLGEVLPVDRAGALARMKGAGWGFTGKGPHARDAEAVLIAGERVSLL